MDEYRSIAAPVTAEIVEKKSRFIATLVPVTTEEEALAELAAIRSAAHGARHNPYAYRLSDARTRSSDDGEPSQTAGRPILDTLVHAELVNVLCVVTRYFGGILLGTGGLVRAYGGTAQAAIEQAAIVTWALCVDGTLRVPYGAYASVERLFATNATTVKVLDTVYADDVTFRLRFRVGSEAALTSSLADILAATPELALEEPRFAEF